MASTTTSQPTQSTQRSFGPGVHAVPLERLPDEFHSCEPTGFPEALADRIWFDSQRKRLAFRGFMSKAAYDRLDGISSDRDYQRAVEELFRQSVYEEPAEPRRPLLKYIPVAVLVTAALLAVALAIPLRFLAGR